MKEVKWPFNIPIIIIDAVIIVDIIIIIRYKLLIWLFCLLVGDKLQHPGETAPPVPEKQPLPPTDTDLPLTCNYLDCTESNDDEEDEEKEENGGKGDITEEHDKSKESKKTTLDENCSTDPPKWEDFFTTETLPDSQNSLTSRSCSVPSPSLSRATGSQTPELFSDGEEEESAVNDDDFSLTLSASLSNHSSQNQEFELADTLILQHETAGSERGNPRNNAQTEQDAQSESQASSDFDIPSTPESKKPRPDELLPLYMKLAAADEMIRSKTSLRWGQSHRSRGNTLVKEEIKGGDVLWERLL